MTRSLIEEDLTIEGHITARDGDVDVKGRVTGDISARSLEIHAAGSVQGAISATLVTVRGRHSGRIDCEELALASTAEVSADVKAQTLSSEKGARLSGKVQISGA